MQGFGERFAETTTYYRQGKQDGNNEQGDKQQQDRVDSGCGTGRSTRLLATWYPDFVMIGVDRSLARLTRSTTATPAPPLNLATTLMTPIPIMKTSSSFLFLP
mmetsp:Transcript_15692/g.18104  ORF Transcript_15692/g.18104 Transcript_15692/m.18104 type:complete len:103 (-) Transcript_15692:284-592(-)